MFTNKEQYQQHQQQGGDRSSFEPCSQAKLITF